MKSIDVNEIKNLDKQYVIDIREVEEYAQKSIEGVKNVPMNGLLMNTESFMQKDKTYYIMCLSGGRSMMTCQQLSAKGYDVVNLSGGIMSYEF